MKLYLGLCFAFLITVSTLAMAIGMIIGMATGVSIPLWIYTAFGFSIGCFISAGLLEELA